MLQQTVSQRSLSARRVQHRKWLKDHRNEYRGKWVAISGSNLIASANSSRVLKQRLRQKLARDQSTHNILITVVY